MSPTQFALSCIGQRHECPETPGARCWLCGGTTETGMPRSALPDTFAQHDEAACHESEVICYACHYFAIGATWQGWLDQPGAPQVKRWATASWRSFSHAFWSGHHECPMPSRWRDLLLAPPEPPFLFLFSETARKNIIFRGVVAHSRERWQLRTEQSLIDVDTAALASLTGVVDAALAVGYPRSAIETGIQTPATISKIGFAKWLAIEDALQPARNLNPSRLFLAATIGAKPE